MCLQLNHPWMVNPGFKNGAARKGKQILNVTLGNHGYPEEIIKGALEKIKERVMVEKNSDKASVYASTTTSEEVGMSHLVLEMLGLPLRLPRTGASEYDGSKLYRTNT